MGSTTGGFSVVITREPTTDAGICEVRGDVGLSATEGS